MSLPAWVLAGAIDEFQSIVAGLDAIAAANPPDAAAAAVFSLSVATAPAISASTPAATAPVLGWQAAAQALYQAIPMVVRPLTGVDPSLPAGLIGLAEGLAAAIADKSAAAAAFAYAFDATLDPAAPPAGATVNRIAFIGNAALIARFSRIVYLAGYAEALALASFPFRPDAITARADAVERFDAERALCMGAEEAEIAERLTALRDALASYLTRAIIDSAPVLTVDGPNLAALVWAQIIYQDPMRAAELIARNAVAVAEFLPSTFEAAAPANA